MRAPALQTLCCRGAAPGRASDKKRRQEPGSHSLSAFVRCAEKRPTRAGALVAVSLPVCRLMGPPEGRFLQGHGATHDAGSWGHPRGGVT